METPPAEDEFLHQPQEKRLWNESYYFDFAQESVQGFTRLGFQPYENRANLWIAVVTDGDTYWYRDEDIPISDVFGLNAETPEFKESFQVLEPHRTWLITGGGIGRRSESPRGIFEKRYSDVALEFDLQFDDPHHRPRSMDLHVRDQDHYNHAGRFTGTITVDESKIAVDADGFRDHSWGWFRDWTPGEWGHYWSALQFDDDHQLVFANQIKPNGGQRRAFGYVDGPSDTVPVESLHVTCKDGLEKTERARAWANGNLPSEFVFEFETEDQSEKIRCTPLGNVPFGFEDRNWELTDSNAPWLTSVLNRMPLNAEWDGRSGMGWVESSLPLD